MPHVFISYSRHDQPYARRLAEYLITSGFDVWIDDRIDYGSRWVEVIQQAIEDCAAFVVIMTPQARESHWVQTECEYAGQKRKKVFPLLLEGDVFFRFVSVQSVNVTDGSLPPQAFLDELTEHVPQRGGRGEDVAHANASLPAAPTPSAATAEPPARFTPRRRRAPLVFGAAVGAIVLVIATLLLRESAQPDELDGAPSTAPASTRAVQQVGDGLRETDEQTPGDSAECQFEWFFESDFALAGDCPLPGHTELEGLVQQWGHATLIGMELSEGGRFFALFETGEYADFIGAWDTSLYPVGACVEQTVYGFMSALPDEDAATEDYACPLQPVQFGTTRIQASTSMDEFVYYIEAANEAIYRLAAPSSRPGTEGVWQRVH